MSPIARATQTDTIKLTIDASKPGAKIDRNLFGQFAEHLGKGVYEGIWVGPDSKIPNTRGIRNDVVAALKAIRVPNVRWPGGCFADEYHWRKGIGPQRVVTLNPNWGGVIEPNSFGTHEFMDFIDQIGSQAYLSVNVGSGTNYLAEFTFSPVNPKVGDVVRFDARGIVPPEGVTIKDYQWDFGDGTNGTGVTTANTYGAARIYTVRLTIVDSAGRTLQTTKTITISTP